MIQPNKSISCSFCTADDWFAFGSKLLTCVKNTHKPISSIILYKFTDPDPQLPKKLAQFWTLTNCFLKGRSRDGLRLAAALCYISHHLYHTDIDKSDLRALTRIIYSEEWDLEPLVIPWRKYKEAYLLIAHQVIDVQMYAEHFSTWSYLFENACVEAVQAQLHRGLNNKMKQKLLIDALKSDLSTERVRKMVLEWGLDVRGLDIFPVIKKVGNGKWNMQTILSLAPLVAQLVALGSTCAIFHPCSLLIIRACRAGIITNLLWRYQKSSKVFLPSKVIFNILQFVSSPHEVDIKKSWWACKMREGDNMMKNVILMLGRTSEIIYRSGVDCTPYPSGDFSQAQTLENRNEYGSNSEFIPTEEKDATGTRVPLRDDTRRKRKWSNPFTSCSDGVESKIDTPSAISVSNNQENRGRYYGHQQPCFFGHDYDKENVSNQKLVGRGYQERTFPEKRDYQAQWNAVRCKPKTVPSIGLQERNVSQKYNLNASPTRSDLQTDYELKMKWTRKKPKSSAKTSFRKSWRSSTPKTNMQNFCKWTPEKFKRLQERISVRENLAGLLDKSSKDKLLGGKGKHFPLGHENQLRRLPEHNSKRSNLHKEKPLTIGQISEKDCKGFHEDKERTRYVVLSNVEIPVEE